jgi:hypothetical protein
MSKIAIILREDHLRLESPMSQPGVMIYCTEIRLGQDLNHLLLIFSKLLHEKAPAFILFYFILAILGFELKALHLLDKSSTT